MSVDINQRLDWQSSEELAAKPTVDHATHCNAMRNFASSVSVITTRNGKETAGLTATAVCSVTADPPRLVVFVNKNVFASDMILEGGRLCVNVLASDQEEVAKAFAGMIKECQGDDRFQYGEWTELETGTPALDNALVNMDCRVIKVFDESTHNAFLCEVLATRERGAGDALIYLNGKFQSVSL